MATILDTIVAAKRKEVERAKVLTPPAALEAQAAAALPPRDFFSPLAAAGPIRLIAEVKKASPSRGLLRAEFDAAEIAGVFECHGATCISVLTDSPFFQGSIADLKAVHSRVGLPVLRKDFILDPYQLLEARAAGADAVLLIAECLDDCALKSLVARSYEIGLVPLVELYQPENLPRVLDAGARLVGVNNRDLRTFELDLAHTLRVREQVPDHCVLVAESGIRTRQDALRLEAAGVKAMLVGESLMTASDVGAAVDRLLGR